uniref:Protein krueppel n=2 Tax=Macrostomum lignano TaxID=282301 RepID=A0A1I8GAC3_9PLAT
PIELMEAEDSSNGRPDRTCLVCSKSFKYPSQLRLHQSVHSLARPFPCDECGRTFKYASTLSEHKLIHAADSKPFVCGVCGRGFAYRGNYRAHAAVHADIDKRERRFRCDQCPAAYLHRSHLHEHIAAKHLQLLQSASQNPEAEVAESQPDAAAEPAAEAPKGLFECGMCGKAYRYRNSLLEHQRGHRKQRRLRRPLKCTVCHVIFDDVFKLRQHVELDDAPENARRHVCCKCGRAFLRRCYLALHVAGAHKFKRRHNCQLCGKSFLLLKCLRQHQAWVHADGSVRNCADCGRQIRGGAAGMRAHAATHAWRLRLQQEEDKAAEACRTRQQEKLFKKQLREKKKTNKKKSTEKENETPVSRFRCDACFKEFPRLFNLQRHQRRVHDRPPARGDGSAQQRRRSSSSNSEARPFKCEACGKDFRWERNLKAHSIALHGEGDRPVENSFQCGQCDKVFPTRARLDTHSRSHYSARPFGCNQCDAAYKHKKNLVAHVLRCHSGLDRQGDAAGDSSDSTSEGNSDDE